MNALSTFNLRDTTSVPRAHVHDFVEHHWPALRNAAELLGGRSAVAEAERLFSDLAGSLKIGVHTRRRIDRLIRLLELDDDVVCDHHVFHCINPCDPVVADLCLLLDGLKHALAMSIDDQKAA